MHGETLKYPVYIISKGRYDNPLTAKMFLVGDVPFFIAVEPHEAKKYNKHIPAKNILVLPTSNLGLGSYPARNFCWEHSVSLGFTKHFIFDDNIRRFVRFNRGKRNKGSATPMESLIILQSFTERYRNVAVSGYNYEYLVTGRTTKPFSYNTHVYSGMLIDNTLPFRWRLKYNEDVDLCLQALDSGYNTILLNHILIKKVSTVSKMKGGNQDELYLNNNREKKILKAKSIQAVWPQYVKVGMRFGRPHHKINWKKHFKQTLKRI